MTAKFCPLMAIADFSVDSMCVQDGCEFWIEYQDPKKPVDEVEVIEPGKCAIRILGEGR